MNACRLFDVLGESTANLLCGIDLLDLRRRRLRDLPSARVAGIGYESWEPAALASYAYDQIDQARAQLEQLRVDS